MPAKKLTAAEIGLPRFAPPVPAGGGAFDLSSHLRAREALEFGLSIRSPGFNIFVLGEDRSGRMTATLRFLESALAARPPAVDWVYLYNFRHPDRPRPFHLPAGKGRAFRDRMAAFVGRLKEALSAAFAAADYEAEVRQRGEATAAEVNARMEALRQDAQTRGLEVSRTPQGLVVIPAGSAAPTPDAVAADVAAAEAAFTERLSELSSWAKDRHSRFLVWLGEFDRQVADRAGGSLFDEIIAEFGAYPGLVRWLIQMRMDVLDNLDWFRQHGTDKAEASGVEPEQRYAVNLLVDRADDPHPKIVLEANPTYENLFGRMEYRQVGGVLETDFSLIRAGSLHRANGGILVLRAEAIANDRSVWQFLKGALRDQEIRIEELHRAGGVPVVGTARPDSIPLDVKVVIVGAPRWYYTFFSVDPDFQIYFKVKADIDPDMDADGANLACYASMIQAMAAANGGIECAPGALVRLLAEAGRFAANRKKLTARFELIEDLVSEAALLSGGPKAQRITEEAVIAALANRRHRNAGIEDRLQENIAKGVVMIDTRGSAVGQVNALTVRDLGDYAFGMPSRVTARASAGRRGITNIEREAELGGPIQQKGVMVLQGFLAGRFARRFPLSFNCSITFEQSYGGVEGDSASMAEVLAILSDLAELPLRQDVAITGSVNQLGQAQAVGGVHHKVEGFFRACLETGGLTGTQGVIVPAANADDLVVEDRVTEAVEADKFRLWSVTTIDEAAEILFDLPAGQPDAQQNYPPDSVYGRVVRQLEIFDRILAERS